MHRRRRRVRTTHVHTYYREGLENERRNFPKVRVGQILPPTHPNFVRNFAKVRPTQISKKNSRKIRSRLHAAAFCSCLHAAFTPPSHCFYIAFTLPPHRPHTAFTLSSLCPFLPSHCLHTAFTLLSYCLRIYPKLRVYPKG